MMPPYTSLWLQILLEIKGTAAWLRTGEASPVSEEEGDVQGGAQRAWIRGGEQGQGPATCHCGLFNGRAIHFPAGTSVGGGRGNCHPRDSPRAHPGSSVWSTPGCCVLRTTQVTRRSPEACDGHIQLLGELEWSAERCPPTGVQVPTPRTYDHVALHGKRDFAM